MKNQCSIIWFLKMLLQTEQSSLLRQYLQPHVLPALNFPWLWGKWSFPTALLVLLRSVQDNLSPAVTQRVLGGGWYQPPTYWTCSWSSAHLWVSFNLYLQRLQLINTQLATGNKSHPGGEVPLCKRTPLVGAVSSFAWDESSSGDDFESCGKMLVPTLRSPLWHVYACYLNGKFP